MPIGTQAFCESVWNVIKALKCVIKSLAGVPGSLYGMLSWGYSAGIPGVPWGLLYWAVCKRMRCGTETCISLYTVK